MSYLLLFPNQTCTLVLVARGKGKLYANYANQVTSGFFCSTEFRWNISLGFYPSALVPSHPSSGWLSLRHLGLASPSRSSGSPASLQLPSPQPDVGHGAHQGDAQESSPARRSDNPARVIYSRMVQQESKGKRRSLRGAALRRGSLEASQLPPR